MKEPRVGWKRLGLMAALGPRLGIAVGLVAVALVEGLSDSGLSSQALIDGYSHALFFFLLFGLPPAYVVEALLGMVLLGPFSDHLTAANVFLAGGLAGGTLLSVGLTFFFPALGTSAIQAFPFGALGGMVVGALVWHGALSRGMVP